MAKVVLTETAWNDLDSITDYIAFDSPRYAREFSDRAFEKIEQLETFPESGRIVPEFNTDKIRELLLGRYRIVYRVYEPTKLVVLRIIHGSKLLEY